MPRMDANSARSTAPAAPLASLVARFETWLDAHPAGAALLLFAFAVLVRAIYLGSFRHTVLARVPFMDEAFYRAEALNLLRGAPPMSDAFFMTPLYPWFLSLVFRAVGDGPMAPYAVQLALGAFATPLTWLLGRHALRPMTAFVAALALASFAPLVFFEALYLVEGLVLLALLAALWLAVAASRRTALALVSGVCLGIAVLGRGSNLALLPVLAIWPLFDRDAPQRSAFRRLLLCMLGCLATIAPLAARNLSLARRPVLLTANMGFNLYIGNGPQANGIFVRVPGLDLQQDPLTLRYVQRQVHHPVTASEASAYWLGRTRAFVRANPGRTARLFLWKVLLFWNRLSIPQVEGFEAMAPGTPLAHAPFWRSFAFLPLALTGTLLTVVSLLRRRTTVGRCDRVRALIATWTWVYATSIALFFVTDRYRVPVFPCLVLLAAVALEWVIARCKPRRRRYLPGLAAGLGAAFFVTSPQLLGVDLTRMRRDLYVHSALRNAEAGLFDTALREYAAARALDPEDSEVRDGEARLLSRAGRDSLALVAFRSLLHDHPDDARVWYNLGNAFRRAQRDSAALAAYQRALALEPEREAAWNQLGEVYRTFGDTARAADCYRSALAVVPAYEQALNNLAALRAFQGYAATAEAGFRAAIAANPRYVPALVNLGILLTDSGRTAEAMAIWRRVLVADPGQQVAQRALRELETGSGSSDSPLGEVP